MNTIASIIVIDDDEVTSQIIEGYLLVDGHTVSSTTHGSAAMDLLNSSPCDIAIIAHTFLALDDQSLITQIHKQFPLVALVLINNSDECAHSAAMLESMHVCACLTKPFSKRQLQKVIEIAVQSKSELRSRKIHTTAQMPVVDVPAHNAGLIGVSTYIKEMRAKIQQVAPGSFPLLIEGPSGTGKEVIANALHRYGPRHDLPLITINCAAIPENLEESEFFGYAKGAFTGANWMKHGIVASADRSTLFLDEIAELSLGVQAKLLRVLDTGEYFRIGETMPRRVDIRVLSATNMNLEAMVVKGTFRQDLLFRLKGAYIQTQPICLYKEDIPYLVAHFLNQQKDPRIPRHITAMALDILQDYHWPGNVRELKHTVAYFCTASIGMKEIAAETVRAVMKIKGGLETAPAADAPYFEAKEKVVAEFDARYFESLLKRHHGNVNQAAKTAGMYRTYLIKKLKEININPDLFRSSHR